MNKDKTLEIIGWGCAAIAFTVSMIQKQLDDKKLKSLVKEEVQKALKQ